MKKFLFPFFFLLIAISLSSQEKFLIKAGKLFNSETGEFKAGMVILVSNNMIDDVKSERDITDAEKKNYSVIDLIRVIKLRPDFRFERSFLFFYFYHKPNKCESDKNSCPIHFSKESGNDFGRLSLGV